MGLFLSTPLLSPPELGSEEVVNWRMVDYVTSDRPTKWMETAQRLRKLGEFKVYIQV